MRWGSELKDSSAEIDLATFAQGLHDVTDGKPTQIKESEMLPLLNAGKEYSLYQEGATNRAAGAAFLAKNAKKPGVHVLDGGLQYEVLKEGTGRAASTLGEHEILFIKWKGMFLDEREFDHHNHYPNSLHGGWPCWIEALKRMKLGDKWRVYSPPEFAFGREGDPARRIGPDSVVIFDLEIREFAPDNDPRLGGGHLGHGVPGRDD
jgi:FKBP-type peptidyl-prolyl cis-trans isomerase